MALIYSMGVTADGFVADRDGSFGWSPPSDELFAFHLARVRTLGVYFCGRRLYEAMLPWETDPSMRRSALFAEFADVWTALSKVVFSRTLDRVEGNARLADSSMADEIAAARRATDDDMEIGGPGLAGPAFELGLVDELRIFRMPVVVGGGTPYFPAVTRDVRLALVETRTFDSHVVYERFRCGPDPIDARSRPALTDDHV